MLNAEDRRTERTVDRSSTLRTHLLIGVVVGIGVAGTLDEVLFHQLLQWHNFYVHTTEYWRIATDGVFSTLR